MGKVCIYSRDPNFRRDLAEMIHGIGHESSFFASLKEIQGGCAVGHDVFILDLIMADHANGVLFEKIIDVPCHAPVIIVSEQTNFEAAESAITKGAWDYFQKPPPANRFKISVQRAVEFSRRIRSKKLLMLRRCGIVGSSATMTACLQTVAACAASDANVLISGETGTGKELFARAIHFNSDRKDFPFVVVDCAALPDTLVESTLFGHEKGAFTTAEKKHVGLVRQAHGGTLFLDEVGELPLSAQKSFLRVLQERTFRPVGGATEVFSNFRLVAATNKNLVQMAASSAFREDLLHRLQTVQLHLPSLRGRESDIKELLQHFLDRICKKHGNDSKGLSLEVIDTFAGYHWPGNVRELINALECALISAGTEPILYPEHLPTNLRVCCAQQSLQAVATPFSPRTINRPTPETFPKLKEYRARVLAEIESRYLRKLLRIAENNIAKACEISGMSRPRLYAMIQKYNLR
ncbi:MAG TPA: sigma-54-dependent Fis family transcriptional regulator [Desulfonatronum sp.]|nr:sigma-54-dependent Fis family transcriptional regulator [Desulfonatronum sp.]